MAHHLDFPDYRDDELIAIAGLLLEAQHYQCSAEAEAAFSDYVSRRRQLPFFANARSVRNALDRARLRQANRLFSRKGEPLTKLDLTTFEAAEIPASRVFKGGVVGHHPIQCGT